MAYRHFTVAVKGDNAEEDQLNQFITSHRIVHITKELVSSLSPPAWCYNVEYDGRRAVIRKAGTAFKIANSLAQASMIPQGAIRLQVDSYVFMR